MSRFRFTALLGCAVSLVSLPSRAQSNDPAAPPAATGIPPTVVPEPHRAMELTAYRAPLGVWYAVALTSTWLPVALAANCRGIECLNLLAGPILRLGSSFGPPIVHWTRGRTGRGFLSLGGQIGAVIVGASIGDAVHRNPSCPDRGRGDESECPPNLGPFIGWAIADAIWATTDVLLTPNYVDTSPAPSASKLRISPAFARVPTGGILQLTGAFE